MTSNEETYMWLEATWGAVEAGDLVQDARTGVTDFVLSAQRLDADDGGWRAIDALLMAQPGDGLLERHDDEPVKIAILLFAPTCEYGPL